MKRLAWIGAMVVVTIGFNLVVEEVTVARDLQTCEEVACDNAEIDCNFEGEGDSPGSGEPCTRCEIALIGEGVCGIG